MSSKLPGFLKNLPRLQNWFVLSLLKRHGVILGLLMHQLVFLLELGHLVLHGLDFDQAGFALAYLLLTSSSLGGNLEKMRTNGLWSTHISFI